MTAMTDRVRLALLVLLFVVVTIASFVVTSRCYPSPPTCDAACQELRARQWDWRDRSP